MQKKFSLMGLPWGPRDLGHNICFQFSEVRYIKNMPFYDKNNVCYCHFLGVSPTFKLWAHQVVTGQDLN